MLNGEPPEKTMMLADSLESPDEVLALAAVVLGMVVAYFFPLLVAVARRVPNVGSVAVVNFFFGWTCIGWVIALAMAARSKLREVVVNVNQNQSPGLPAPHQMTLPPPGWFPDPTARHETRYWNGTSWTHQASDDGTIVVDPL